MMMLLFQHKVAQVTGLIHANDFCFVCSLHPGLYIGTNEGSPSHQRWYYEAHITQLPAHNTDSHFHVRVGWASPTLFQPRPSSNSSLTTSGGIGDDLYSVSFDGEFFWFGGQPIRSSLAEPLPSQRKGVLRRQDSLSSSPVPPGDLLPESARTCGRLREGDVIGCYLDLCRYEVWFSKNGCAVPGVLRLPHLDDVITPAISVSSSVR